MAHIRSDGVPKRASSTSSALSSDVVLQVFVTRWPEASHSADSFAPLHSSSEPRYTTFVCPCSSVAIARFKFSYILVYLFTIRDRYAIRGRNDEAVSHGRHASGRGLVRSGVRQTFAWWEMGWEGERREGCPRNRNGSAVCQRIVANRKGLRLRLQ